MAISGGGLCCCVSDVDGEIEVEERTSVDSFTDWEPKVQQFLLIAAWRCYEDADGIGHRVEEAGGVNLLLLFRWHDQAICLQHLLVLDMAPLEYGPAFANASSKKRTGRMRWRNIFLSQRY